MQSHTGDPSSSLSSSPSHLSPPFLCRDLKPENILVTLDGDIKVVDFGVSQDFGSDTNEASGFVRDTKGSWPFWAPEMIDNHSANAYSAYSADVWAAGVCLWIFVFGSLPFWAPGPSHLPDPIFDEILSSKTSPPKFPSRRSPELCELLHSIFTVSPQDRPTFQDLLRFDWIQQHTQEDIERRLNAISSVSIDCSDIHLDAKTAVTPGEVNFLSDKAKSHFVNMAQRIREKVKERHQQLLEAKDEEIETKREEMKHYDPIPTSPPVADPPSAATASLPPPPSSALPSPPTAAALEPKSSESKFETEDNSSSLRPTPSSSLSPSGHSPKNEPVGLGIGREFSKQSNWTSQTGLVAAAIGSGPASHHQMEGVEVTTTAVAGAAETGEKSSTKEEKNNNCACCNVQ
jgi:serine/threonine protein kinase